MHSTSPSLGIAVMDDGNLMGSRVLAPGKSHLENLAPLIREFLSESALAPKDLDAFGVAIGPGSFSGIRVGMATVNGMALALGRPVVGVSSLEILAWLGLEEGRSGIAVIRAGRGDLYAAWYKNEGGRTTAIRVPALMPGTRLREIASERSPALVICVEPALRDSPVADSLPVIVAEHSASACGFLAWTRLKDGDFDSVHSLTPLYVRRSDAEVNRSRQTHR
ncbi:MAG: tRNA (adenosine(37)-N6)-threonylcarbamoyltransferase complex dimerization subunit type 1 TsaB [Thermodesulfobacteriota bacterium]